MKKIFGLFFVFMFITLGVYSKTTINKDIVIKNKSFSVTMPEKYKEFYKAEVKNNRISIYDKASKKAGFGGHAFSVIMFKNPAEHAMMPGGNKIGELVDKNGVLYDMVIDYPTDVQYDYTQKSIPESYKALYELGSKIQVNGVSGAKYFKNQGMKGADLYGEILDKHVIAIKEKWDSSKLEQNKMSYMYNVVGKKTKALNKIGYAYCDINGDGIEELLIGEIANDKWKGVIYDIYTMVNRSPRHVVSGGSRDRYFACNDGFVCNEYSSGAKESGMRVYVLIENSTELFPQVFFKYDGYQNPKNPWFLSYGGEASWKNVDEAAFKERKKVFDRYKRFDFIPLSKVNNLQ